MYEFLMRAAHLFRLVGSKTLTSGHASEISLISLSPASSRVFRLHPVAQRTASAEYSDVARYSVALMAATPIMSARRARPPLIFFLLLLVVTGGASGQSITYVSGSLHWPAARADCVSRGGDLASISSSADETAAAAAISAGSGTMHTWIGFSCAASGSCASETEWAWADGTAVGYTNWHGSEPNGATEDCAMIKRSGAGWGNVACTAGNVDGYLCETPPVSAPVFSWAHKLAWKMRRVAADDFGGGAFFVGNCAWRRTRSRSTEHIASLFSILLLSARHPASRFAFHFASRFFSLPCSPRHRVLRAAAIQPRERRRGGRDHPQGGRLRHRRVGGPLRL